MSDVLMTYKWQKLGVVIIGQKASCAEIFWVAGKLVDMHKE